MSDYRLKMTDFLWRDGQAFCCFVVEKEQNISFVTKCCQWLMIHAVLIALPLCKMRATRAGQSRQKERAGAIRQNDSPDCPV
jgi:hypothetical protein